MKWLRFCLFVSNLVIASLQSRGEPPSPQLIKQAAAKIDSILETNRKAAGVLRNEPTSDGVFVRRIFLDLAGRIPTPAETVAFIRFEHPEKRAMLIDNLMRRESYTSHFFNFWADILRYKGDDPHSPRGVRTAYRMFIEDSISSNKPYDRFVYELLTAKGYPWETGAVGYFERDYGMPLDNMAITSRVFLGTQIECAQCHNHPFDKWKQTDFYKLAAYTFGNKQANPLPNALFEVFGRQTSRMQTRDFNAILKLPRDFSESDGKPGYRVHPASLFGKAAPVKPGQDPAEVFAAWVTSPENPRFTRVIVNRLWKKLFGLPLTRDFEELRDSSTSMIPDLEHFLEELMVGLKYDTKAFLTILANTETYQSSVALTDPSTEAIYRFPGPLLRRMTAEQIWDSLVALVSHEPEAKFWRQSRYGERGLRVTRQVTETVHGVGSEALLRIARMEAHLGEAQANRTQLKAASLKEKDNLRRAMGSQEALAQSEKASEMAGKDYDEATLKVAQRAVEEFAQKRGWKKGDVLVDEHMSPYRPGNSLGGQWLQRLYFPGYGPNLKTPDEIQEEANARKKGITEYAARIGIEPKDHPPFIAFYEKSELRKPRNADQVFDYWFRASELPFNPAPRGHFLRVMGQSDRNLVDNGRQDASIPQAMLLMNSELVSSEGIMAPFSPLMLFIGKETSTRGKMNAVYLALLSRNATPEEHAIWENKASKVGLRDIEDLIYAVINTQQFLFIQ